MFSGIFNSVKENFRRPNNAIIQLIIINVVMYVLLGVLGVVLRLSGAGGIFAVIHDQFVIPPLFEEFILRPWTILTYAFAHDLSGIFHILFNMLFLYWFGQIVQEYLGGQRVINLYILGALAGGFLYLIAFNTIPYFVGRSGFPGMVGASAAVYAVTIGAATLRPDHSFFLIFLGPVKIKYIALFYVIISIMGLVGPNEGGNLAHLGGAFMGWLYVSQLQKGRDFGSWITRISDFFRERFGGRSRIRVTHRKQKKSSNSKSSSRTSSRSSAGYNTPQDEIDAILDKINDSGYESLTKEEKQKLFNAGK
ncbi:rhomboid family intramembrane serine protease [Roseivirga sp. BDSF3-8]|uniref:rhomboid family intramembrane serine protease n=1 Tax=Roseivirga sp. BDSF3-8 TaxID=3241598 RepID=UPI0035323BD5